MKTLIIWVVIVAATVQSTTAQRYNEEKAQYGITISQFNSQSGFKPGYDVHLTVQPNYKAKVGFGLFIDTETKEFAGFSLNHQRMLFASEHKIKFLQPFIMYNFIYRKTKSLELISTNEGFDFGTNWATYTSMEHHLGLGLDINISDNILLESSFGYGLYLGSIKRPSADPATKEVMGTSGGGFIFKTGFGFRF
jgi:hypothetical protein